MQTYKYIKIIPKKKNDKPTASKNKKTHIKNMKKRYSTCSYKSKNSQFLFFQNEGETYLTSKVQPSKPFSPVPPLSYN